MQKKIFFYENEYFLLKFLLHRFQIKIIPAKKCFCMFQTKTNKKRNRSFELFFFFLIFFIYFFSPKWKESIFETLKFALFSKNFFFFLSRDTQTHPKNFMSSESIFLSRIAHSYFHRQNSTPDHNDINIHDDVTMLM